jgi:hypothetical protein
MGLHRDVLDQLPGCFIALEASGDGLRPAVQQSQSFVEGSANHAFHEVKNAVGVAVLTGSRLAQLGGYVILLRGRPGTLLVIAAGNSDASPELEGCSQANSTCLPKSHM